MICQDRSCNNLCSAHPFRQWACSATGGPGDDEGTGDADDKSNVTVSISVSCLQIPCIDIPCHVGALRLFNCTHGRASALKFIFSMSTCISQHAVCLELKVGPRPESSGAMRDAALTEEPVALVKALIGQSVHAYPFQPFSSHINCVCGRKCTMCWRLLKFQQLTQPDAHLEFLIEFVKNVATLVQAQMLRHVLGKI